MSKYKAGDTYGRLTVISISGIGKNRRAFVRCECGTEKSIRADSLLSIRSCGCLNREHITKLSMTHGYFHLHKMEYTTWTSMIKRCHDPKDGSYPKYGGAGIFVCDRWRSGFMNFFNDMGPKPTPAHEIDRIDYYGPYSPENCRWATDVEQSNNRRSNRMLTMDGETKSLARWVRENSRLKYPTVQRRLDKGWDLRMALSEPKLKG